MSTQTLRRSRFKRGRGRARQDTTSDLQAELALLQEENRQLKTRGAPDLATMMDRIRRAPEAVEDPLDEAAAMLAENLVIRESLVELCRELRRASAELEARLLAVGGDA
ncbi:hypothetical protein [Candidatus Solirubrobacter pratensis]|uniref:hypothetical protein n=1 Tax=Candidatus Solirubrobacter pratensis TaxID=1298857 RepID=UPI00040DCD18|nr:hypothetical protein [Candidatus Solirubrobacter pratensis]